MYPLLLVQTNDGGSFDTCMRTLISRTRFGDTQFDTIRLSYSNFNSQLKILIQPLRNGGEESYSHMYDTYRNPMDQSKGDHQK